MHAHTIWPGIRLSEVCSRSMKSITSWYMERVYTTLDTFFSYYDRMLDLDPDAYHKFCEKLSIPDIIIPDPDLM